MAIQLQGNSGTIAEVDGTNYRALRTTLRPIDTGTLGSYRVSLMSGTMAAGLATSAEIWQLRWTDASRFCVINTVLLDGFSGTSTAFTAGVGNLQLIIARSWTADGSGGTAATLTGNNQKLRSSMGTSLMGAIRIASTAQLGNGSKTFDSQGIGSTVFAVDATPNKQHAPVTTLFSAAPGIEAPIVLAQNEGLSLRAFVPATGTWQFGVTVHWTEVTSF
jgi:hypothetical protein